MKFNRTDLKKVLDQYANQFNHQAFIFDDPISIPKSFTNALDIEISGLIAAIFSWGLRSTIISKAKSFIALMDNEPYQFIVSHSPNDRLRFQSFKHRTFNGVDAMCLLEFLQKYYTDHNSLENVFLTGYQSNNSIKSGILKFRQLFIQYTDPSIRTLKHIPNPEKGSACKRINMYLRWMVRKDHNGVDFGIWSRIPQAQLMIPLDIHVSRVARHLGLLNRDQDDWKSVEILTHALQQFDPEDPVRYDYAMFSMGLHKYLDDRHSTNDNI